MGSGDSKAELATVELVISIVFHHRSLSGGLREKTPCRDRHFPSLSTNTVEKPSNESTPIPWLITGYKDKERREEVTSEHSG